MMPCLIFEVARVIMAIAVVAAIIAVCGAVYAALREFFPRVADLIALPFVVVAALILPLPIALWQTYIK